MTHYDWGRPKNTKGATLLAFGGDLHGRTGFAQLFRARTGQEYHAVGQGWQLQACLNDLEARVADGRLRHPHTPLLDFNVSNLRLEDTPNGRRFSKRDARASGQGLAKIDGVMALLSAIQLWADCPMEPFDVSAYIV
jgi:phage terminase large subunit-like protein